MVRHAPKIGVIPVLIRVSPKFSLSDGEILDIWGKALNADFSDIGFARGYPRIECHLICDNWLVYNYPLGDKQPQNRLAECEVWKGRGCIWLHPDLDADQAADSLCHEITHFYVSAIAGDEVGHFSDFDEFMARVAEAVEGD
jgi:hypothetical protein